MYQAASHRHLHQLLEQLEQKAGKNKGLALQAFYSRLSANYHFIFERYQTLYSNKPGWQQDWQALMHLLFDQFVARPDVLKKLDLDREQDPEWLMSQNWVGMMFYVDHFAGDLKGFLKKIPYLNELGINWVHLMPLQESPPEASDGGYSVSNYRRINPKLGALKEIKTIADALHKNGMLLTLDLVLNHTSDQHQWAQKARQGIKKYQHFYYCYPDRTLPDEFEKSLPEVFPTSAPGNFTYNKKMDQWVMTVFHEYQWDLNYTNPEVLAAMLENMLFLAHQGADILRLDAPAFLWKELGTHSQNLPQAHTILQLFRACAEVVAPGIKSIAEAIVAPEEIVKYFGTGTAAGRECEVAYHATLMALLWEALATGETRLLYQVLTNLPCKPAGTTWINYLRCHDDIGLGFHDRDIYEIGLDARMHRQYLVDYYSGKFPGSPARAALFMVNPKTGDARISGSLASLAGLETAKAGTQALKEAVQKILMLHSIIFSYGGLPLLYSGDEIAQINDYAYLNNPDKAYDNRWMHRPLFNWEQAVKRKQKGTVEYSVFTGLQKLIKLRKSLPVLADLNNCQLAYCENKHILAYQRAGKLGERLLVLVNFHASVQYAQKDIIYHNGFGTKAKLVDLYGGKAPKYHKGLIEFQSYQFYWLKEKVQKKEK